MTWNEFKDYVDTAIQLQGFDGSIEIAWIDVHMPDYVFAEFEKDEHGKTTLQVN